MTNQSMSEVSEGQPCGCQNSAELWLFSPGPVLSMGFMGDKRSEHKSERDNPLLWLGRLEPEPGIFYRDLLQHVSEQEAAWQLL